MGWISDAWESTKSFASSAVKIAANVASTAWEMSRDIAAKAVVFMADKGELVVVGVKAAWKTVKPHIVALSPLFKKAALAATSAGFPWLGAAILYLDKGLQILMTLENSPVLKKIEQGINWAIKTAKHIKQNYMSKDANGKWRFGSEDVAQAEEAKRAFIEAMNSTGQGDKKAFEVSAMLADFVIVEGKMASLLDSGEITDFDHYLRLLATQKLLQQTYDVLQSSENLEDITDDDIFLLHAGNELLSQSPNLSDSDFLRIDRIVSERFNGKRLLPFVFEELIYAWQTELNVEKSAWDLLNKEVSAGKVALRRLETHKKISGLNEAEQLELNNLKNTIPADSERISDTDNKIRSKQIFIQAAEGFIQLLEKSPESLVSEGKEYLIEEGGRVGKLIIDCIQKDEKLDELDSEIKSEIIDYANIFKGDSEKRISGMLGVAA